jgi:Asp-tRNA(Asn)/Glu-tRNA(Gln) amidotransferase A subunit family amidase
VDALFQQVDILITPATPIPAPRHGEKVMVVDGVEVAVAAHLGRYTQPISFIGLPVIAVPIPEAGPLPIGVQIIGPPWREDLCFRAAAALEASGAAAAPPIPANASQN